MSKPRDFDAIAQSLAENLRRIDPPQPEPLPVRDPGATFRQPAATIARPEQPDWARHHAHHAFGDD